MTANTDLEKLAKDFMDLWQEHLAQQAADPALARWAQSWLANMPTGVTTDGNTQDGAASPAAASGDFGERLDEFARRLGACEDRLDKLERKSAAKGPRKRGPDPDRDRGGRR